MATPKQASRAAEMHADDLSSYPNVVGVGTQPVDDDGQPAAKGASKHAVAVYVRRKVPASELEAGERLPAYVEVPEHGRKERVPVVVVESGAIAPEADDAETTPHDFTSE